MADLYVMVNVDSLTPPTYSFRGFLGASASEADAQTYNDKFVNNGNPENTQKMILRLERDFNPSGIPERDKNDVIV